MLHRLTDRAPHCDRARHEQRAQLRGVAAAHAHQRHGPGARAPRAMEARHRRHGTDLPRQRLGCASQLSIARQSCN